MTRLALCAQWASPPQQSPLFSPAKQATVVRAYLQSVDETPPGELVARRWIMLGFRRREAELAAIWERALALGLQSPTKQPLYTTWTCLGRVTRHKQRARRGTKARVRWVSGGRETSAWFWYGRPRVGGYILAVGQWAPGTHHRENVFYVQVGDWEAIPRKSRTAYRRQRRRQHRHDLKARWMRSSSLNSPDAA
jgi:hypothetical protein